MTAIEAAWDEGCELPTPYGTEFDIDALMWMDTATKTKAAADAVGAGIMTPNEARFKTFGLKPVPGGDTCYLQQQQFSLEALAVRDAAEPFATPTPAPAAGSAQPTEEAVAAAVGDLAQT
jgi:phage portal protein BeeE